tara:strand:- start:76 stop:432 length:357 start_codon:yes stop_codon:yes gene_type:complete
MTLEEVKTIYGSAAHDYSRPDKNNMIQKVFETSDEISVKRGFLAHRSINGLNNYEIQLPRDEAANMRRDWPSLFSTMVRRKLRLALLSLRRMAVQSLNSQGRRMVNKRVDTSRLARMH